MKVLNVSLMMFLASGGILTVVEGLSPQPMNIRRMETEVHYTSPSHTLTYPEIESTTTLPPQSSNSHSSSTLFSHSFREKASFSSSSMTSNPSIPVLLEIQRRRTMQRPEHQHSRVHAKKQNAYKTPATTHASKASAENRRDLLDHDEECIYSYQIKTFRAATQLRDDLVRYESSMYIHPTESEWAAACGVTVNDLHQILSNGKEARSALVAANVGLVTSIATRYYSTLKQALEAEGGVGTILTIQDMIQEGNLGLIVAAERFEPERGFRFSTYATYWIRQRILASIADTSRTIRLPAHVHSMIRKINKAKKIMKSENGRTPTMPELAQHLAVSEEKIQRYTASSRNVVSLENPMRRASSFKEDRRTLMDKLASDHPTPEEETEADYFRRDIMAVVDDTLADREREVIVRRFGLDGGEPRTVNETASHLGISRDRVRLLEAKALNKLRHPQRNYRLKEYVNGGVEEPEVHALSDSRRLWF